MRKDECQRNKHSLMNLPIKGIIPPVITPLTDDGELDTEGLRRLIQHLIEGGVHGLFILGTTGEAPGLSLKIRQELIQRVCDQVDQRIPVLVGITDTSLENTLNMAGYAKACGADIAVVTPPYYFPISEDEMIEYMVNLSAALPLPFVMYNIPSHTKTHLSLSVVERCKELGALGIKDSSGDVLYFYSIIDKFKDSPQFACFTGTELFLPETILYGGHGAVAGGANMFPRLFVDLYEASVTGDLKTIKVLRDKVMKIYNTIYNIDQHPSRFIRSTKCALSAMGICNDYVSLPYRKLEVQKRDQIKKAVETILFETHND